ncbi:MAG: effector binding domain-containing protein [Bdellovibrionaceae bacterium]|nr:effector binding domain-containing protein [Pseudobdellovibrionaceae bacterium]
MSYVGRVQKAVDFIEDNLRNPLDLLDVAKEAAFSPYHFHRIFSLTVGETIKDYIRKRRLTEAALELRDTERRILDIAIDYQFESQESFGRAFKKMFEETPGKYRSLQNHPKMFEKRKLTEEAIMHRAQGIEVNSNIVTKKNFWVVGLEYKGPQKFQGDLWDKFIPRMKEVKNRIDGETSFGVCYATKEMTKKDELSYMAALPVSIVEDVPEGMTAREVIGGEYVVVIHKGSIEKIGDTIDFAYGTWLPRSGYDPDDRADLELYDARFKAEADDSEFDFLIPIKKRES